MEKTETPAWLFRPVLPVRSHSFEQPEGADDIGLDEVFRALNGSVNMAFRGKIYIARGR